MPRDPLDQRSRLLRAWHGFHRDLRETLKLAVPVMIGRIGILAIVAVDTAMTGHAGAEQLAWYALGMAPQVPLMLIGMGLMLGAVVLTAQAFGAGDYAECGRVWRVALHHGLGYGTLLLAISQAGTPLLLLLGQPTDLAQGGGRVLAILGYGMPAMLLYGVTTFFLEAIHRPVPGMVVMVLANILNAALNWILIYGHLGLPALGAEGAAMATTIARWFLFLALVAYVLARVDSTRFGVRGPIPALGNLGRRFRRIGYPMALSQGLEASAFAALTIFAGYLSGVQVAAFQIALNLIALPFMCAVGMATAASVRVGNAVGRDDLPGARRAGWTALGLVLAILVPLAGIYLAVPAALTAIYTADPAVAGVAALAIVVAAFVLLPDGSQAVLMGALRGAGDVWPATLCQLAAFWMVMLPLAYLLAVVWQGGAPALMQAVVAGCLVSAALLAGRFHVVSRRRLKRR